MHRSTITGAAIVLIMVCVGNASSAGAQGGPIVPQAPAELQHRPTNIVIRLSDAGIPSINNQTVPWARLSTELKAVFAKRPEKILFLQTTPQNRVEDVRRIVALTKKQGILLYALLGS